MAFNEEFIPYPRWTEFHFYYTGKINGWENQTLTLNKPYKLKEIRLKFSSAFASIEDLSVRISSIKGSYFNYLILSQPLSDIESLRVQFSDTFLMFSEDTISFNASMVSNTNGYGLEVFGWAIYG